MASINGAYGDITINNNITTAGDLETVLNAGNTMAVGQTIDATAVGGTAIDATGSDGIFQNLQIEKVIPLGFPIITNLTLDGGLTIKTGANYAIDFQDGIQLKDNTNAFIYSDGTDLYLNPTGEILASGIDLTVGTLNYTTLNPPVSGGGENLEQTLTIGNDANNLDITNLGNLNVASSGQVDFNAEIRISKATTDFVYTDPADNLYLNPSGDSYVGTLHYTLLDPVPQAPIYYQTYYANLGDNLQNAVLNLSGSTRRALYISTGSWSIAYTLDFSSLDTVAIVGQPSYTPNTRITSSATPGFSITGASTTRCQFRNIDFAGEFNKFGTAGRHRFEECGFLGGLVFSGATSNFITFNNCEFSTVGITIPNTFAGSITFTNCNFASVPITLNNSSPLQVIFSNCINLPTVNESKCTVLGLNQINSIPRVDTLIGNFNGTSVGGVLCNIDPVSNKGFVVSGGGSLGSFKAIDGALNSVSYGISPFGDGAVRIDGGAITTPSSSGSSGNHLRVIVNGTPYVIDLRNP
jgi:hypothetical protein